jgi:hypothetical protein
MSELINLIYPIVAAVLLASYMYVKQATGSNPESFDLVKFSATVLVGSGIAVVFYFVGSPISSEAIYVQIIAYSGLVLAVESWIKIVTRGAVKIQIPAAFLPVAAAAPVQTSRSAPAVAPVLADPLAASAPAVADPLDTIGKIAVKSYPAILQGVSPFRADYLIACDPAEGIHAAVKAFVDHGDGSPVEEIPITNGVAHVSHIYEYVQGLTLVKNLPSPYYSHVFMPAISVVGRDGLTGGINRDQDSDGKREISLTITVKDAAAVAAGKVTNYPAPAH